MELTGFYNEQTLDELLGKGEITELDFIRHHSEEMNSDFKYYCENRGIKEDENAALAYAEFRLKREQNAHSEGLD